MKVDSPAVTIGRRGPWFRRPGAGEVGRTSCRVCRQLRGEGFFMSVEQKKTGKGKWFNDQKGFGFIQQDGGGEDVFVHHSQIVAEGYRSLAENDAVQYEVETSDKGLKAVRVSKVH